MPKKTTTRDTSLVKGAAYSHADILNFDSMCVAQSNQCSREPVYMDLLYN